MAAHPAPGAVGRLHRSRRGISEIVGALMLVLIVVVAATAFALFVQSYQKQLQAERALAQQKGLETLRILSVAPTPDLAHPGRWSQLNLSLASEYVNPSTVNDIRVNGHPLSQYSVWRVNLSNGALSQYAILPGANLVVAPHERLSVLINISKTLPVYSFVEPTVVLAMTDYVQVDLVTQLQNDFEQLFLPPTAIALVSSLLAFNGTGWQTVPVLDGSNSYQKGNATIVSWDWNVTLVPPGYAPPPLHGEKVVTNFTSGDTYDVSLTVTNSDGLIGLSSVLYKFV